MQTNLTVSSLPSPQTVKKALAASSDIVDSVHRAREEIKAVIGQKGKKIFLAVGPCSIHNVGEALEYARRLKDLASETSDFLSIAMRVNFEKPRTTLGWKGILHEPSFSCSPDLHQGLLTVRELMLEIAHLGVPIASELLDPCICYYIGDLISWAWIGSRTSESQIHRQFVSGLSIPAGFKNGTDGSIEPAVQGIKAASHLHTFFTLDDEGRNAAASSKGNPNCHLILRGGKTGPNYSASSVDAAAALLSSYQLPERIVIDCSHDNARGEHRNQEKVFFSGIEQIVNGDYRIRGFMLESNLEEGKQPLPLKYGISLTDPCLSWKQTEKLLLSVKQMLGETALSRS